MGCDMVSHQFAFLFQSQAFLLTFFQGTQIFSVHFMVWQQYNEMLSGGGQNKFKFVSRARGDNRLLFIANLPNSCFSCRFISKYRAKYRYTRDMIVYTKYKQVYQSAGAAMSTRLTCGCGVLLVASPAWVVWVLSRHLRGRSQWTKQARSMRLRTIGVARPTKPDSK
jgi:hypothetical protein